jgi:hypothetical protein
MITKSIHHIAGAWGRKRFAPSASLRAVAGFADFRGFFLAAQWKI